MRFEFAKVLGGTKRGSATAFSALPASRPRIPPAPGALVGPSGLSPSPGCPGLFLGPPPFAGHLFPSPLAAVPARSGVAGRGPRWSRNLAPAGAGRGGWAEEPCRCILFSKKIKYFHGKISLCVFLSPPFSSVCPFLLGCLPGSVPCLGFPGSPPPWLPWLPLWVQPLGLGLARPCTPSVRP